MSFAADALAARVRETGLCSRRVSRSSCCCPAAATRSPAGPRRADLAGPSVVSALHVNYGLRTRPRRRGRVCRRSAGGSTSRCRSSASRRRRAPETCRRGRGTCATGPACASRRPAARRLAAGHTTTDQAETILYRLAASPGRRALIGMPERRGLLIRPLLAAGVSREETGAWCAARGLSWVDDASNDSDVFMRGRVRARTRSPRCASCTPPPRRTCCAPPSCCATRRRSSTS